MVQRPRRVRKNMEIKMTSLSISRWFSLGALVLTISGTFSLSANGQTQATQPATQNVAVPDAGQKLLMAKADAAPAANLTAAEAATPAPATSAPVPPPAPSSYSWTGFHVGVNFGRGSSDTTTAVNPLPSAATFVNLLPRFYTPGAGRILLDGHDILALTLDSLRANLALVSQEIVLFNDSVFAKPSGQAGGTTLRASMANSSSHRSFKTTTHRFRVQVTTSL